MMSCSLSRSESKSEDEREGVVWKVYVYDLPPELNTHMYFHKDTHRNNEHIHPSLKGEGFVITESLIPMSYW
jgi:hypothetical protein